MKTSDAKKPIFQLVKSKIEKLKDDENITFPLCKKPKKIESKRIFIELFDWAGSSGLRLRDHLHVIDQWYREEKGKSRKEGYTNNHVKRCFEDFYNSTDVHTGLSYSAFLNSFIEQCFPELKLRTVPEGEQADNLEPLETPSYQFRELSNSDLQLLWNPDWDESKERLRFSEMTIVMANVLNAYVQKRNMRIVGVLGDGHCFFRSFLVSLALNGITIKGAKILEHWESDPIPAIMYLRECLARIRMKGEKELYNFDPLTSAPSSVTMSVAKDILRIFSKKSIAMRSITIGLSPEDLSTHRNSACWDHLASKVFDDVFYKDPSNLDLVTGNRVGDYMKEFDGNEPDVVLLDAPGHFMVVTLTEDKFEKTTSEIELISLFCDQDFNSGLSENPPQSARLLQPEPPQSARLLQPNVNCTTPEQRLPGGLIKDRFISEIGFPVHYAFVLDEDVNVPSSVVLTTGTENVMDPSSPNQHRSGYSFVYNAFKIHSRANVIVQAATPMHLDYIVGIADQSDITPFKQLFFDVGARSLYFSMLESLPCQYPPKRPEMKWMWLMDFRKDLYVPIGIAIGETSWGGVPMKEAGTTVLSGKFFDVIDGESRMSDKIWKTSETLIVTVENLQKHGELLEGYPETLAILRKEFPGFSITEGKKRKSKKLARRIKKKMIHLFAIQDIFYYILSFCHWNDFARISFVCKLTNTLLNYVEIIPILLSVGYDPSIMAECIELCLFFFVESPDGIVEIISYSDVSDSHAFFRFGAKYLARIISRKEYKTPICRRSYDIPYQRLVVQEYVNRMKTIRSMPWSEKEKKTAERRVAMTIAMEFGIPDRNVRKWVKKTHLQPTFVDDENHQIVITQKRVYKKEKPIGRKFSVGCDDIRKLQKYVNENYVDEKQIGRWDFNEKVEEKGIVINPHPTTLTRLMERVGETKVMTNKPSSKIDEDELSDHELFIIFIRDFAFVSMLWVDEKPIMQLLFSKKGIVPFDAKMVTFSSFSRSNAKHHSLVTAFWSTFQFGKLQKCGKAGFGIIMKGTITKKEKKLGKLYGIPRCCASKAAKRKYFKGRVLELVNKTMIIQTPTGMMKSALWVKFLPYFAQQAEIEIRKAHTLTESQFNASPKFIPNDGAKGHADKLGETIVKEMWEKFVENKPNGWKERKLPANSSGRTQGGDLGPHKKINEIHRKMSRDWRKGNPQTKGGNFRQPPQAKLIEMFVTNYWDELPEEIVKVGMQRSCVGLSGSRPLWYRTN